MLSSAQPAQPHEKGPPPRATQVSEENALEGDDCSAITLGSLAPLIWGIQVDRRAGPSAKVAHGHNMMMIGIGMPITQRNQL